MCSDVVSMFSTRSFQVDCILPFGMLCLSALRMMFMKNLFAVSMLVGGLISEKTSSVSVLNCVVFRGCVFLDFRCSC